MIRFPGSDFRAEVPPNLSWAGRGWCPPHVNTIWATDLCFTLSSFSSHSSIFLTRKGYKWALWDPPAEGLGCGTLCISNISVWCVISQMQPNSVTLSGGNGIGHAFSQRGATRNEHLFTARSQKSCTASESDFPGCRLPWPPSECPTPRGMRKTRLIGGFSLSAKV